MSDSGAGTAEPRDIRVLVVDDQALVRAGFRTILDSEPGIVVVGEAADGEAAIEAVARLDPDVVCMDVQMPGMDGLTATRRIVEDVAGGTRPAVLVLTTFNREDYLFQALEAGASGFLLKNSSPEQLIDAVQVVARGDALLSPDVTRAVIAAAAAGRLRGAVEPASASADPSHAALPGPNEGRPATDRGPGSAPSAVDALTDREREVLELLALGISNAEIAERLWVGESTVKTHVSKVLQKLALRDRVHAVVFAYEHGVVRPGA
ncbi:response regulator transcription factor [Agromyces protaetiae]|uniref:Response regulator transcription factor n=1 Tax=Agromyces protaetiae TaxID=2509455 RepID=A0A4P6FAU2_9MICO|nr:response regulator transcription factor [Agromyces protaetiae]QAY72756.1 response regulator transcription factor [Agromyces protaetiae]